MISLLCLHRFLLDKGLVDFIVVMHNRYTVQCKLHRFIFNFLLVRTTSHQIVSRYCCALKPSLRIFATVDYRKNKFVSWLENFVLRLLFVRSFYAPGHSLSWDSTKVTLTVVNIEMVNNTTFRGKSVF